MPPTWLPLCKAMQRYCEPFFVAVLRWSSDLAILTNRMQLLEAINQLFNTHTQGKELFSFQLSCGIDSAHKLHPEVIPTLGTDFVEQGDIKTFLELQKVFPQKIFLCIGTYFQRNLLKAMAGFTASLLESSNRQNRDNLTALVESLLRLPNEAGVGKIMVQQLSLNYNGNGKRIKELTLSELSDFGKQFVGTILLERNVLQSIARNIYSAFLQPTPTFHIYSSTKCQLHSVKKGVERIARINAVRRKLDKHFEPSQFVECRKATNQEILLFHTQECLDKLLAAHMSIVELQEYSEIEISEDTIVMEHTVEAAVFAVGAVLHAIDDAFLPSHHPNHIDTAFCNVRPPGHHAFPNRSSGFCFFNNVGVGAKYAMSKYGVERVAILDFDAHHGNGTEAGVLDDERIFYASTHEEGYPENSGKPIPVTSSGRHKRILNRFIYKSYTTKRVCEIWETFLEKMILFRPQLILLSAGFDAHKEDPLTDFKFSDTLYTDLTTLIIQAAIASEPTGSPPPIISVLEGGYHLEATAESALEHIKILSDGYCKVTWKLKENNLFLKEDNVRVAAALSDSEDNQMISEPTVKQEAEQETEQETKEEKIYNVEMIPELENSPDNNLDERGVLAVNAETVVPMYDRFPVVVRDESKIDEQFLKEETDAHPIPKKTLATPTIILIDIDSESEDDKSLVSCTESPIPIVFATTTAASSTCSDIEEINNEHLSRHEDLNVSAPCNASPLDCIQDEIRKLQTMISTYKQLPEFLDNQNKEAIERSLLLLLQPLQHPVIQFTASDNQLSPSFGNQIHQNPMPIDMHSNSSMDISVQESNRLFATYEDYQNLFFKRSDVLNFLEKPYVDKVLQNGFVRYLDNGEYRLGKILAVKHDTVAYSCKDSTTTHIRLKVMFFASPADDVTHKYELKVVICKISAVSNHNFTSNEWQHFVDGLSYFDMDLMTTEEISVLKEVRTQFFDKEMEKDSQKTSTNWYNNCGYSYSTIMLKYCTIALNKSFERGEENLDNILEISSESEESPHKKRKISADLSISTKLADINDYRDIFLVREDIINLLDHPQLEDIIKHHFVRYVCLSPDTQVLNDSLNTSGLTASKKQYFLAQIVGIHQDIKRYSCMDTQDTKTKVRLSIVFYQRNSLGTYEEMKTIVKLSSISVSEMTIVDWNEYKNALQSLDKTVLTKCEITMIKTYFALNVARDMSIRNNDNDNEEIPSVNGEEEMLVDTKQCLPSTSNPNDAITSFINESVVQIHKPSLATLSDYALLSLSRYEIGYLLDYPVFFDECIMNCFVRYFVNDTTNDSTNVQKSYYLGQVVGLVNYDAGLNARNPIKPSLSIVYYKEVGDGVFEEQQESVKICNISAYDISDVDWNNYKKALRSLNKNVLTKTAIKQLKRIHEQAMIKMEKEIGNTGCLYKMLRDYKQYNLQFDNEDTVAKKVNS